ncbi:MULTISPECIES: FTR1 family protein [Pseudomonas]|uniref:FTR1 family protein n=1 Tax=Pseudomonas sp. MS19 TaxID=2579939 RepID=UPI000854BC02|nr:MULTISPECIES: FTR1 family protein [Pseudomonas]MAB97366.1 cystathionine gamma-synthase [Pseudomonadaceae bacterium]NRH27745.1 c-type cytochrome [Pseudomonas sp. MS19]OEO27521.1 cystathionine gamma-synthase [Pseudomonas sp. J237]
MFLPRRLICWLLLPLTLLCSLAAMAEAGDGAAQALHMLGYLGADYPATVADGKIIDASEYQEQLEFLTVLQGLIVALPAQEGRDELVSGVASLRKNIEQREDGGKVAIQARQLAANLVSTYQVSQAPAITPDPTRGEPLFAQHCAVCHGQTGAGDGPAGIGLEPPPANLRDAARIDRLSLYDIYNTIGLGIEGTDMAAFADQLDDRQRWDLASYIAGFTAAPVAEGKSFGIASLAAQTPAEVATAQGPEAAALFRAQRAQPPVEQRGPAQLIDHTRQTLEHSLKAYTEGDSEQAYDLSVGAYLEGFELVESALNNIDSDQRKITEKALMAYRQALQDGLSVPVAAQRLEQAKVELAKSSDLLGGDAMSASLTFISSLLILLREGLEAILVLAAILAFLRNTGQEKAVRSVHVGWGLAIAAGFATWALAAYLIDVSGAQRELLEGATALFASVMVLWLGVWMHDRRHAAAWQSYIKSSLVSGGGRFGFALLAFFSVYRELFEVILFYETLWLQAGPEGHSMVIFGACAALVILIGLAWVILRGSRKLPLATFFSLNAILLCVLSVVFAGHGIAALQEAGVIGTRPVNFFEFDWMGIHPDAYSLGAQAVALTAIVVLYGRSWLTERRRAEVAQP